MMWRALHFVVAFHWALLTIFTIVEVATNGELARTPYNSPNFSTASVLWFVTLGLATAISAMRAWVQEPEA